MNPTFELGPLILPWYALLVLTAALSGVWIGKWIAQSKRAEVTSVLWKSLLVGMVTARLAFVWEFRSAYTSTPLDILNLRDGGWTPWAGVVGAWLFTLSIPAQSEMKKALRVGLLAGTAVWFTGAVMLATLPLGGAKLLPISVTTLEGKVVKLDGFGDRPTVVNLWATWCSPCGREMPVFRQAQTEYPSVNFLFLNQGESSEQVQAWLARRKLTLRNVLLDEKHKAGAAFNQKAVPTTLFFNAQGQLVGKRIGEVSTASLAQKLQPLLQ